MADFVRPYEELNQQNTFSQREVGVTHPDFPSFIKLLDNGDIEINAADGLAIVLNAKTKSITFIADTVTFLTRDTNGLKWNKLFFNERATVAYEPTLESADMHDVKAPYRNVEDYLPTKDEQKGTGLG